MNYHGKLKRKKRAAGAYHHQLPQPAFSEQHPAPGALTRTTASEAIGNHGKHPLFFRKAEQLKLPQLEGEEMDPGAELPLHSYRRSRTATVLCCSRKRGFAALLAHYGSDAGDHPYG